MAEMTPGQRAESVVAGWEEAGTLNRPRRRDLLGTIADAIREAVAAERAACAAICDVLDECGGVDDYPTPGQCAAAIRARGEAPDA